MELLPILLIIGLFAALAYSIFYSSKLEEQIWERDKTIRELSFRSKLVEDYFDINYNPNDSSIAYYTLKDSIKNTYKTVQKEYIDMFRDPIIRQGDTSFTLDYLIKKYNALQHESGDIIQEYNSLINEIKVLTQEKNRDKEEIRRLNTVLQLIEKQYKISYNISADSNMITTTLKNTDMVDSGLMLLPYYRDKIERESNGTWIITHTKKQEN